MSNGLLQIERRLRSAVERRCYPDVRKYAAEFCAQAAEEWRAFPSGDARARHIFDHLQSVLEWTHLMVRTSRALQAAELRRVRLTNIYLAPSSPTGNRLRCDG